mgnify:FL=1
MPNLKRHTIILINVCEAHYVQWAPQWSMAARTQVVEHFEWPIGKTKTPSRKEFLLTQIKKIVVSVLPSTFIDMLSLCTDHQI